MANVIICLGNAFINKDAKIVMRARVKKAVELYKAKQAKKIIFSGGYYSRKDLSEAKFMSDYAIKLKVPRKNILLEQKSETTVGNAYYSQKVAKFKSAIVVTSPQHIMRTKQLFRKIMKNKQLEFIASENTLDWFSYLKQFIVELWHVIKNSFIDVSKLKR